MSELTIPKNLVEQLCKGNCVLFVGAGISMGQGGLPGGWQLAKELTDRCDYPGDDLSLDRVAQKSRLRRDAAGGFRGFRELSNAEIRRDGRRGKELCVFCVSVLPRPRGLSAEARRDGRRGREFCVFRVSVLPRS